jgi:hypothetical protein
LEIGVQNLTVGRGHARIHPHEYLPGLDLITLLDEDLFDNARIGGLHDLQERLRNQLALRDRDDVEPAERRPEQQHREQCEHCVKNQPWKWGRWRVLRLKYRR